MIVNRPGTFRCWGFYRKRSKSSKVFNKINFNTRKVFNKINFNTLSKRVFFNQEFAAPKDIIRFGAKFFGSPTGSRHLGEIKTGTSDKN